MKDVPDDPRDAEDREPAFHPFGLVPQLHECVDPLGPEELDPGDVEGDPRAGIADHRLGGGQERLDLAGPDGAVRVGPEHDDPVGGKTDPEERISGSDVYHIQPPCVANLSVAVLYTLISSIDNAFFSILHPSLTRKAHTAFNTSPGFAHGTILDIPWGSRHSGEKAEVFQERRRLLGSLGLFAGAAGLLGALAGPFYFWKNRNTYTDVNVGRPQDGQMMAVEVANKPVWILKRSPDVIRLLEQENPRLLDPRSVFSRQPEQALNGLRSIRPEYFVVYGICTHLGCAPSYRPEGRDSEETRSTPDPQFFFPCHAGVFDLAGRVFKGTPPPENMVVPSHEFVSDEVVRLYYPSLAEEWHG